MKKKKINKLKSVITAKKKIIIPIFVLKLIESKSTKYSYLNN